MRTMTKQVTLLLGVGSVALIPVVALGGTIGTLNVFGPGNPAKSETLNANFSMIKTAVNGSAADIGDRNALQTTAKTSLVDAINELRLIRAPSSPYMLVGPAKVDGVTIISPGPDFPNQWAPGATLMKLSLGHPLPKGDVIGKPFTGTISFETEDANVSQPGAPILGGQLVVDFFWQFDDAFVVQTAVATFTVDAGAINRKSATIAGVVPAAPATDNQGFAPKLFQRLWVMSGAGTTAKSKARMTVIVAVANP